MQILVLTDSSLFRTCYSVVETGSDLGNSDPRSRIQEDVVTIISNATIEYCGAITNS